MKINRCIKSKFTVIGKLGSTNNENNFIKKLWDEFNTDFDKVYPLIKKDDNNNIIGYWGAMSDFSMSFKPWSDNFTQGLYLAGVECIDEAIAPDNFTKWIIPSYKYIVVEVEDDHTFINTINYLKENNIELVGAVHDYTDPKTQINYMYFPIEML